MKKVIITEFVEGEQVWEIEIPDHAPEDEADLLHWIKVNDFESAQLLKSDLEIVGLCIGENHGN